MVKTPVEKWKAIVTKYRKQCQDILKISKSIRYAGVINAYGRTLAGITRSDAIPLLKSIQVQNEFFVISTLMSLRKENTDSVGKLEHIVIQHQKITIIVLQKKNVTYYVSIERKEKDVEKLVSLIKKKI